MLITFDCTCSYADDTILLAKAEDQASVQAIISSKFLDVAKWYRDYGYTLNIDKTKSLIISKRSANFTLPLRLKDIVIFPEPRLRLLGFTLNTNLSFLDHANLQISKINSLVFAMRKIRHLLNTEDALLNYKAIMRPILEYYPSVLSCGSLKSLHKHELCQNRTIRANCNAPKIFPVSVMAV